MTIGQRLKQGFNVVLYLLAGIFAVNLIAIVVLTQAQSSAKHLSELQKVSSDAGFQMMQNRLSLSNYLLSGAPKDLEALTKGSAEIQKTLDDSTRMLGSSNRQMGELMVKLREAEQEWKRSFADLMVEKRKQVDAGNTTVGELQVYYLTAEPEKWLEKSREPLNQLNDRVAEELASQQVWSKWVTAIAVALSIIVAIMALVWTRRIAQETTHEITEPLQKLMAVAREIGENGDLDQKVDIHSEDEVGELAKTFNAMVGYLKEMAAVSEAIAGGDLTVDVQARSNRDTLAIAFGEMTQGLRSLVDSVRVGASQVASGSDQVASASEEAARINVQAASAIDEVTSTMHEMSVNVQNMVKNTQTQASSVSETSASIDQMVASIQRVADTAKVLLDISQRSREEVQNGIATMDKATSGLNRINQSIEASSSIIGDLGQKTDDIGKIVEVIDDLAEQTNLLALNAAIEAARAGEHGLGFAVVADEVRKLAEKSAQSTREISELISGIQKEARKAVENMGRSTTIVEEGLVLGEDLGNALKKISNVVTEVYKFAQEIGAATNEQSHGSTQIAKATTRLNEITHEINSAVEEQSSGTQAVVRAMEKMRELTQRSTSGSTELAASAEEMTKMARGLLASMDRFIIDSNGHRSGPRRLESTRVARLAEKTTA
jgi:methyl-accepting chemotaxis protein